MGEESIVDISILIPSIRTILLKKVYNSIAGSFHGSWELVIVGPYPLPEELADKPNITYIEDWGSPIRSRQRGLIACKGDWVCYAADDCTFIENSLDKAFALIKDKDYKTVVLSKYSEGMVDNVETNKDEYYKLGYHEPHKALIARMGRDYYFINTGLVSREFMMEIGGFDCKFEACAMAVCDLSIRLQNEGATVIIQKETIFNSTHLPATMGDHGPIHRAQMEHDHPYFHVLYWNKENHNRGKININNWEKATARWKRRFGNEN